MTKQIMKNYQAHNELICHIVVTFFCIKGQKLTQVENIRIYHEYEGGIEKSVPRIGDWHHEACRVMKTSDLEQRIFLSHPHTNKEFFFLLSTKYLILYWKNVKKGFQKIMNSLRCDMVTSF